MYEKLYRQILEYSPYDEREKLDREVMLEFMKNNEDILTRNNRIAHFTASAWITNKNRTKVLMVYHNQYNSWAFVGGHADGEENLMKVAEREIEEETGLHNFFPLSREIFALNILSSSNHIKRGKIVNTHLHFDIEYLFEADEKEKVRIKENENSGVGWIAIDDMESAVSEEEMKPVYRRLNEKLRNRKG